jgi:hypothetical protein
VQKDRNLEGNDLTQHLARDTVKEGDKTFQTQGFPYQPDTEDEDLGKLKHLERHSQRHLRKAVQ